MMSRSLASHARSLMQFSLLGSLLADTSHGAGLRALQQEGGNNHDSNFHQFFDVRCRADITLHDVQDDNTFIQQKEESRTYHTSWLKEDFAYNLDIGALDATTHADPRQMLLTIPSNGKFVFWGHELENIDSVTLSMSLFTGNILPDGTLSENETKSVLVDSATHGKWTWDVVPPKPDTLIRASSHVITLPEGPKEYIIFTAPWYGAYQHILIDQIGYWAYLKEAFPTSNFVFVKNHHDIKEELLTLIDPAFLERVTFLECDGHHNVCQNQLVQAPTGSSLSVLIPRVPTRNLELLEKARRWILEAPRFASPPEENVIIYYKRTAEAGAYKGRVMNGEQEEAIIQMIEHSMKRHNRQERLVVFDGSDVDLERQINLFRSASVVIGPHGGALANLLMSPKVESCDQRTKVIEFVTTTATPHVQGGGYALSYYTLYSTMPWVDLHQVFYIPPSGHDETWIDLDSFRNALNDVMMDHSSMNDSSPSENTVTLTSSLPLDVKH